MSNTPKKDFIGADFGEIVTWEKIGAGIECEPCLMPANFSGSVQFAGQFNGGSVALEGSNDGKNFHVLVDIFGEPLRKMSGTLKQIADNPRFIRPVANGQSPMEVSVIVFYKKIV